MVEFPKVAEVVFRAGCGACALRDLHRQTGKDESLAQAFVSFRHSGGKLRRARQRPADAGLDELPRQGMDGIDPDRVRQHPVRAGGNLRREVSVPGGSHGPRGRCCDVEVEDDDARRGTRHRDLHPVLGHRRPEARVSVHRGRSCDHCVGPVQLAGGELRQVVESARADCDRKRVRLAKPLPDFLAMVVGGVKSGRSGVDHRLREIGARFAKRPFDVGPGGFPRALVGDEQRFAPPFEQPVANDRPRGCEDSPSNLDGFGVACILKPSFHEFRGHRSSLSLLWLSLSGERGVVRQSGRFPAIAVFARFPALRPKGRRRRASW